MYAVPDSEVDMISTGAGLPVECDSALATHSLDGHSPVKTGGRKELMAVASMVEPSMSTRPS